MATQSRPRGRPPKDKRPTPLRPHIATESDGRFHCTRCTRDYSRQKGYFSVAQSPLWKANNGYLPVCRQCVEEMFNNYKQSMGDESKALRRLCMMFDVYWSPKLYETAVVAAKSTSIITEYFGRANIYQCAGKTYDNTLEEDAGMPSGADAELQQALSAQEEYVVTKDDIDAWGDGFTPEYYASLNRRYKEWTNGREVADHAERSLYRKLSLVDEQMARAAASGESIDKYIGSYNKLLDAVGAKPSQSASDEYMSTPLGVWLKRYENERPLPQVDPELRDANKLVRYINIWYRGHMAKMMGVKNAYSKMYDEEIAKIRVEHPEYVDDDDDTMISELFSDDEEEGEVDGDS